VLEIVGQQPSAPRYAPWVDVVIEVVPPTPEIPLDPGGILCDCASEQVPPPDPPAPIDPNGFDVTTVYEIVPYSDPPAPPAHAGQVSVTITRN
jgi:hypothetical protein